MSLASFESIWRSKRNKESQNYIFSLGWSEYRHSISWGQDMQLPDQDGTREPWAISKVVKPVLYLMDLCKASVPPMRLTRPRPQPSWTLFTKSSARVPWRTMSTAKITEKSLAGNVPSARARLLFWHVRRFIQEEVGWRSSGDLLEENKMCVRGLHPLSSHHAHNMVSGSSVYEKDQWTLRFQLAEAKPWAQQDVALWVQSGTESLIQSSCLRSRRYAYTVDVSQFYRWKMEVVECSNTYEIEAASWRWVCCLCVFWLEF